MPASSGECGLKLLKGLAPGDVVTVTRIDRLARGTFDLFAIVKQIVDSKAHFRSLAEPWADTGTSTGRLMIAVLGRLADVERDLIRTRKAKGRSRAQKRGQHMGRPSKPTRRRPKHGGVGRGAQHFLNSPAATMSARTRFHASQRNSRRNSRSVAKMPLLRYPSANCAEFTDEDCHETWITISLRGYFRSRRQNLKI